LINYKRLNEISNSYAFSPTNFANKFNKKLEMECAIFERLYNKYSFIPSYEA